MADAGNDQDARQTRCSWRFLMQVVLVLITGISASRWGYSTYYLAFNQMLQARGGCLVAVITALDCA